MWAQYTIHKDSNCRATQLKDKQLAGYPELREKLTPKYQIGCKRIIASDDYYPTLLQSNVDLETRPIHSIKGRSVLVTDQSANDDSPTPTVTEYDLIVCATGFQTLDFLAPVSLYGTKGRALREDVWREGAYALYGITVEDMPNFAMLYGPNTNLGHNSIILMVEAQSRYISGLIKPVLGARRAGGTLSLRPRADRLEEYNKMLQEELQTSSFNDPRCKSWYKNAAGRITNNWSRTVVAYQKMVQDVDFADYVIESSESKIENKVVPASKKIHVGRVHEETSIVNLILTAVAMTSVVAGTIVARNPKLLESLRLR